MYSFSAVSFFLLANAGGVASASVQRKRFTVNTDAKQPSEAFGLSEPFGVERDLLVLGGSMSMSMSMSMMMFPNPLMAESVGGDVESDATPPEENKIVKGDNSRACSYEPNGKDVYVEYAYQILTDAGTTKNDVDQTVLDGIEDAFMACDNAPARKLSTDSKFSVEKVEVDSKFSPVYKCGEGCNVVISTLKVSTDSETVPVSIVVARTLSVVEQTLSDSSVPFKTIESLSAPEVKETPKEDVTVSAKNYESPAEEEVTKSGGGISGAAAGAVVAGVLAVVFGGVALVLKKKSSSSREEYFGQDVPETGDMA